MFNVHEQGKSSDPKRRNELADFALFLALRYPDEFARAFAAQFLAVLDKRDVHQLAAVFKLAAHLDARLAAVRAQDPERGGVRSELLGDDTAGNG